MVILMHIRPASFKVGCVDLTGIMKEQKLLQNWNSTLFMSKHTMCNM